jgi:hypothetical protein
VSEKLRGQILNVKPAPKEILTAGDLDLAKERSESFRSAVKGSKRITLELKAASKSLEREIDAVSRLDRFSLVKRKSGSLRKMAGRVVADSINKADIAITNAVESSVDRGLSAQARYLKKLGLDPISSTEMAKIKDTSMVMWRREFPPGSGMNYHKRLLAIGAHHKKQIVDATGIASSRKMAPEMIKRRVSRGLFGTGRVGVSGGSLSNKLQRLMVAEETRMANFAEIRFLSSSGIDLAYWRLDPSHKWYGGTEICEHLASVINPVVRDSLEYVGIHLSDAELMGLHPLEGWPAYPHPYCKCHPEPWYPVSGYGGDIKETVWNMLTLFLANKLMEED